MSGTASRIVVVGEALIDEVVHPDGHREEHPGGSPANVAITLGRLGNAPRLITQIGDDASGGLIREWLESSHVVIDAVSVVARPTSRGIAHLDDSGAATYEFDLVWDEFDAVVDADFLHIGSISATLQPGGESVRQLIEGTSALVTYDPNIRPSLIDDAEATRASVEALIVASDVVKASDEDIEWLYPGADVEQVAHRWADSGPWLVIVTRGGDGVLAFSAHGRLEILAPRVVVADTVGAGDTLMGTLIDGLAHAVGTTGRAGLEALSAEELTSLLERAAAAAAITVSRPGANPPWSHELEV